jgi:GTPase
MSPITKKLIVVFGGMAVMVVTTVCGAMIMIALDDAAGGNRQYGGLFHAVYGGVIGASVGVPIWGLLGYMVLRVKKPPKLPPGPPSS